MIRQGSANRKSNVVQDILDEVELLAAQIGLDPVASPIVDELQKAGAMFASDVAQHRDFAIPAIMAKLPRPLAVRPAVSAIIPNYNHSCYLDARIGSILDQRVMPAEIIVVDDCSTDDSLTVIERWKRNSPVPFTVVQNDRNSGSPFGQWAKGLVLAAFDLAWIAESDDTSSPHFLERLITYFADDCLALAYAESGVIGAEGQWHADSYRLYTDSISPQKWLTAYVEDGRAEIDQALAIKNTIPNASAVCSAAPFSRDTSSPSPRFGIAATGGPTFGAWTMGGSPTIPSRSTATARVRVQ